ncbi:MAG: tRNA uridine-5-carboxymethylaminomethyl(34) synthesis GTPase MnmE, partial [Candidatus Omnitrophota bacterium]
MGNLANYNLSDTIAAVATFPSASALGVIKVSGRKAIPILSRVFRPKSRKSMSKVKTYTLHYGWITTGDKTVDEALVSVMRRPRSYTREDVVEISSHGGVVVLNKILGLLVKNGARLAKPGEFSYRAFINGRIDLSQVQAIADIVDAKDERALFSLSQQLKGEFSKRIGKIVDKLKEIISVLEAAINFPDEETGVDFKKIRGDLNLLSKNAEAVLNNQNEARILRQGLRCVICGKSNVGKSTIFNRLLKEERVIVTHRPGTTRDAIEETIIINGVPLKICDTAGIVEAKDFIDKQAMRRSYDKLAEADIVLFIFDYSRRYDKKDACLMDKLKGKNTIFIVNKIDLKQKLDLVKLKQLKRPLVKLSALKTSGLDALEKVILKSVYVKGVDKKDDIFLLARWQVDLLKSVRASVIEALGFIKKGYSADYVSFSLKPALDDLSKLSGETASEEILSRIFSSFCIG